MKVVMLFEQSAEIRITDMLINTRARLTDYMKIVLTVQQGGNQRPLSASPGTALVNKTAIVVKHTVPVFRFHLNNGSCYFQKTLF
jgi:hypothetical protein